MRIRFIFIALLVLFACEDKKEDKHGCLDSQACNYNSEATIDNNSCLYGIDCEGVCGGDKQLDNCGTCDSDTTNNCTQDCANVWGGTAQVDNCGTCDSDVNNDCVQGHIELEVAFEDYMAGENATMIMAFVWEGATWEAAAAPDSLGLPTVGEVQNKMFGINPAAEIHGEYSVTFNLPEGKYYVGVFETFYMAYIPGDTALQLVGYYNATVDTTHNSDTEPSPLNLSEANNEYDIMLVAISKDCAGVPGGNAVLDCAGVCDGTANLDVCGLCVEPGNECVAIVSGAIQLTVDFNDYETQSDAAMIMAYLWTGTTWDTATLIEGPAGWGMFPLAPPGTFDGPTTVTFQVVAEGTYFVGVFETTGMAYDIPLATVGYYNQTVAEEFNSPDTPTGLTTTVITMHAGH